MSSDSHRTRATRCAIASVILLVCIQYCDCRDVFTSRLAQMEHGHGFVRMRKDADWIPDENCPVHKIEHVHTVMDRVCLMCHEMFSQKTNTLRFECRKNCFDNTVFRKCLSIFTAPQPKRPLSHPQASA